MADPLELGCPPTVGLRSSGEPPITPASIAARARWRDVPCPAGLGAVAGLAEDLEAGRRRERGATVHEARDVVELEVSHDSPIVLLSSAT